MIAERLVLEAVTINDSTSGSTLILDDINLRMAPGQILGVLGPNGSGKTSLVRAIAGFIRPRPNLRHGFRRWMDGFSWGEEGRCMSGRILLDGEDVSNRAPGQRGIALVPQNLALYPDKTVLGNITFPLLARHVVGEVAEKQAIKLACSLELKSVLYRRPAEISGGQQQRVAIARALIGQPRLVLLDEPLASLDALSKREILTFIGDVLRERQASAVYVTHDPEEANLLCDVVAFVHGKRLHQLASPKEAYLSPATLFVARMFSGFSNAIPGTIESNGWFTLNALEGGWDLRSMLGHSGISQRERIWLAARPRAFALVSQGPNTIQGVVTSQYSLEGVDYVQLKLPGEISLSCPATNGPGVGSSVAVALACPGPADVQLFDQAQRLMPVGVRVPAPC